MSDLPVNVDSTYSDDAGDASVKSHQQHHDALHGLYNDLAGASPDPGSLDLVGTDGTVLRVVKVTQAAYDALGTPVATTLYVISG
jgi:hypothetical protein